MNVEKDTDYIEDEYYVYIDFEDNLTSFEANDPNLDLKIIGIDSENPIMEVNGKTFKGNYEYAYCTNVLFEKDDNPPVLDPIYEKVPEKFYRLIGKTNKKITMKRMFFETKNESKDNEENEFKGNVIQKETLEELKERLEVNSTYEDALNLLLPPGKKPPRKIETNDFTNSVTSEAKTNIPKFKNSAEMYEYVEDCDDDEIKDPDYVPTKES